MHSAKKNSLPNRGYPRTDDYDTLLRQLNDPGRVYRTTRFLTLEDVEAKGQSPNVPSYPQQQQPWHGGGGYSPPPQRQPYMLPSMHNTFQNWHLGPAPQTGQQHFASLPPRQQNVPTNAPLGHITSPPKCRTPRNVGHSRRQMQPVVESPPLNGSPPPSAAWVVIQGAMYDGDWMLLNDCMKKLGFDQPRILHRPMGVITKMEVEKHIKSITSFVKPGANLLLMIASQDFNAIELDKSFLNKEIYKVIALRNSMLEKEGDNERSVWRSRAHYKGGIFDSRPFEGVTLHVILDNVPGDPLPHLLEKKQCFDPQYLGPHVQWSDMPPKEEDACFWSKRSKVQTGRIVQLWRDGSTYGFYPMSLFNAFLCVAMDESHLPYNVLLFRLEKLLSEPTPSWKDEVVAQLRCARTENGMTTRSGGTVFIALHCLFQKGMENQQQFWQRRDAALREEAVAAGRTLFSSACLFDPHLSLDVNWEDKS